MSVMNVQARRGRLSTARRQALKAAAMWEAKRRIRSGAPYTIGALARLIYGDLRRDPRRYRDIRETMSFLRACAQGLESRARPRRRRVKCIERFVLEDKGCYYRQRVRNPRDVPLSIRAQPPTWSYQQAVDLGWFISVMDPESARLEGLKNYGSFWA